MDLVVRRPADVWHHDVERDCWTRTTPGPVAVFGSKEAAQRYASRFPIHALRDAPTPTGCPDGCKHHPPDCDIKASANGYIYRLPGDRDYEQILIVPGRGDRWFCTEEEAWASGWNRSPR